MSEPVVTAEDLERMSPAERKQAFETSIIWDLEKAPPELVDRARKRLLSRIAESATPAF